MSDISDAGHAMAFLSVSLAEAEEAVKNALQGVLRAQAALGHAIDTRDTIQKTLNLTAQYVATETKR